MSVLVEASWTHGVDIQVEDPKWFPFRQGFGTTIRPNGGSSFNWIHMPISTPVIVNNRRLHPKKALIRLAIGATALLTNFHVFDGEKRILRLDGLAMNGTNVHTIANWVPNTPEVLWGTGISLGVKFRGNGGKDDYVYVVGGGD